MDSTTFLWTLAATILAGIQMFTAKIIAHGGRSSAYNGIYTYGVSGLMALVALVVWGSYPDAWLVLLVLAVISGAMHAFGQIIRIDALRYIDATIYFPLNKILGPIVVVAGGVFVFHETLTVANMIGICLSLCVPLLLLSNAEQGRQTNLKKGLIFLVVSTGLASSSMLLTKAGADIDTALLFFMSLSQLGGAVFSVYMYRREVQKGDYTPNTHDVLVGLASGTLAFVSFYALLKAYSLGSISLIYTIHAHYILIPIFLSVWYYKEHMDIRKFIAVVISVVAIGLLY